MSSLILILLTFMLQIIISHCDLNYGILHLTASVGNQNLIKDYCISYNPEFGYFPPEDERISSEIFDMTSPNYNGLCDKLINYPNVKNKLIFVMRGNCTFLEKANTAIAIGAKGLVIVNYKQFLIDPRFLKKIDYPWNNITISILTYNDYTNFRQFSSEDQSFSAQIFSLNFDCIVNGMIFIFIIAFLTIFTGSYWSGVAAYAVQDEIEKEIQSDISWKYIVSMVTIMCCVLLLLYFFYKYIVYFFIAIYVLGGTLSILHIIHSLILVFFPNMNKRRIDLTKIKCQTFALMDLCLFFPCAILPVWWVICRHEWYAWILQDIIGFCFCIVAMKKIRLSNFMIGFILLSLLLLYDVFFVFITPYFTKDGNSIMMDVATGGKGQDSNGISKRSADDEEGQAMPSKPTETLPLVFLVPRICSLMSWKCPLSFTLLGYGDVVIPGLIISYLHKFDLHVQSRRVYFISTIIAYGIGLIITFLALHFMEKGQPALLYLVPCVLITPIIISLIRREIKALWFGKMPKPNSKVNLPIDEMPVINDEEMAAEESTLNLNIENTKHDSQS